MTQRYAIIIYENEEFGALELIADKKNKILESNLVIIKEINNGDLPFFFDIYIINTDFSEIYIKYLNCYFIEIESSQHVYSNERYLVFGNSKILYEGKID